MTGARLRVSLAAASMMGVRAQLRVSLAAAVTIGVLLVPAGSAHALEQTAFLPTGYSPFGSFSVPTGVAVDPSTEEVLVADGGSTNVVDVFGLEGGAALGSIAGTGSETFSFENEFAGVAIDNDPSSASFHDLYVSDVKHNVVDKFQRTGPHAYAYVCQFNGWYGTGEEACHASGGSPEESFSEPLGVATDAAGDVYIASYGPEKGAVDEFDSSGKGILRIKGAERPSLNGHPQGLAVDSTGDIFVSDYESGRNVTEFKRSSLTGGVELERLITSAATSLAVDPLSGDLYIDRGNKVAWYHAAGGGGLELSGELGGGVLGNSEGIAVNGTAATIYTSDAGQADAEAFLRKTVRVPDVRGACVASEVSATSAKLGGEVDPLSTEGAQATFGYGIAPNEQQSAVTPLAGTGFRSVFTEVTGLTPGERYHCQLNATNTEALASGIVNHGADGTFETLPLLPVVDESPPFATEITAEGAILNGLVNPGNGVTTTYHFAYGRKAAPYEHVLPNVGIGNGFAPIPVEQAISPPSLKPNTTYHFALIAHNAAGTVTGHDETFTTASIGTPPETPPVVSTGPAEAVAQNTATLTGTAYPENTLTICSFQLGIDATYGTLIFTGEAGRERGAVRISQPVASLQPGTTYHYRLECTNAAGTSIGPDRSFTTSTFPQEIFQPATPALVPIPVFPKVKNPVIKHPRKKKKPKKKRHRTRGAGSRARRSAHSRT